jgi:hypothetical protein
LRLGLQDDTSIILVFWRIPPGKSKKMVKECNCMVGLKQALVLTALNGGDI